MIIKDSELTRFAKNLKAFSDSVDKIMTMPESNQRGRLMGKLMTSFDFVVDQFLHIHCNVELKNLSKVLNKSFKIKSK